MECQPTRQAQWSHECASDDKTRPGTYQRFVEALVLRVTLSCTRRRPSPHSSAAAGWTWLRAQPGCFDFSRTCVPICDALVATGGAFRGAPRERRGASRKAPRGAATRRGPLKPLWEHLKSATVPRRPDVTGPFFLRRLRVIAKSVPCKLTAGTSGRRASAARFLIFGGAWRRVSAAAAARWRRLASRPRRVGRGVAAAPPELANVPPTRCEAPPTRRGRDARRREAPPTRRRAPPKPENAPRRAANAPRWVPVAFA